MRKSKRIQLIIFALFIIAAVSFLFGLYFRTIHGDEPILAEQVLSFQKLGFVKAELFDGMGKGWELRQYHFHKFFILLGVLVTKIFGFNIWVLRLVSLFSFIGLIFLFFKYLKTTKAESKHLFVIAMIVLLANFTVFEYAFLFRPEIMIATLGFLSFLLLHQFIQSEKIWLLIGSGAVAGFCAFTHLNGLSFILTGSLFLLIFSKWKSAFLFGISAGLVALLYFFDLNSLAELSAFWEQFSSDPNLNENDFKVLHAVVKVFNEHMRFFWNLPTAAFSGLYLFCLISNFSFFKKEHPTLLWYHLILIVFLSALAQSKTIKYGLVYIPFIILIISISLNKVFINKKITSRSWLQISFFVIYFIVNLGFSIQFMSDASTSYLINKNEVYKKHIKENSSVLTTESFYFNGYQNHTIHSILAYELLYEVYLKTPRSRQGFYKFAKEQNNDYILLRNRPLNSNMLSLVDFDNLEEGTIDFGYKVILKNKEVVILENIEE